MEQTFGVSKRTERARKATVTYQKGKPNGEAEFYFNTGVLKIKGRYKDGLKSGKWKHYTLTGELIDKEKWKKGNLKQWLVARGSQL